MDQPENHHLSCLFDILYTVDLLHGIPEDDGCDVFLTIESLDKDIIRLENDRDNLQRGLDKAREEIETLNGIVADLDFNGTKNTINSYSAIDYATPRNPIDDEIMSELGLLLEAGRQQEVLKILNQMAGYPAYK